jgi:hypothetical protein
MSAMIGTSAAAALGACVTLAAAALWYRLFPELRAVDRL